MVLHISTIELVPKTQISIHLHILEMECNTSVGTSLNEEEDTMVEAHGKATKNLNVNFVEELVMLSCNATTDLINLLQDPHNFKEIVHRETWLIFINSYLKFFFPGTSSPSVKPITP
ncbi:hypothetical protein CK203_087894 [Vitis vinifera]|uniref:Uncharacterized protein n=1 Tax=Vitis vinifera TaxID=29760 RepID=A0A438DQT1_VITVI|nr:hypothetical protein CK203_087894 [Vitis vinifera]